MNPTLRRVLAAGLGTLAVTERALRELVDDLVKKGDITRSEGEKLLDEAAGRWAKRRAGLEKNLDSAVEKALDRFGLARKADVAALEHRLARVEGNRSRSRGTAARTPARPPRRPRTPKPPGGPAKD